MLLRSTVMVALASTLTLAVVSAKPASAARGECLQPATSGSQPTIGDCLFILQARSTTGSRTCEPTCICDADGDERISSLDAFLCLRHVLELDTPALCSICEKPLPPLTVLAYGTADLAALDEYCPREMSFSILLGGSGQGWVAMSDPPIPAEVFEVEWAQTEAGIAVESPRLTVYYEDDGYESEAEVGWRDMLVDVRDDDGGGIAETGTASLTAYCDYDFLTIPGHSEAAVAFTLGGDVPTASVVLPHDRLRPLYAFADAIVVHGTHPLRREGLAGGLVLLVNDAPQAADVTVFRGRGPFAMSVKLDPVEPLPFGAAIDVAVDGVADAFGRPAVRAGPGFDTVADPAALTSNGGFESGGGWIGLETSTTPFYPVEGARYASVLNPEAGGSDLFGYADVPVGAATLRFWGAVLDHIGDCALGTRVTVATRDGEQTAFAPAWLESDPCSPGSVRYCLPWTEVSVDVSHLGGQRLVVRATASADPACAPDVYENLLLDDFHFE